MPTKTITFALQGTDTNTPMAYSLTYSAGALPAFINIASLPTITVSPGFGVSKTYSLTARVTDSLGAYTE